jgi:hypothetical protein
MMRIRFHPEADQELTPGLLIESLEPPPVPDRRSPRETVPRLLSEAKCLPTDQHTVLTDHHTDLTDQHNILTDRILFLADRSAAPPETKTDPAERNLVPPEHPHVPAEGKSAPPESFSVLTEYYTDLLLPILVSRAAQPREPASAGDRNRADGSLSPAQAGSRNGRGSRFPRLKTGATVLRRLRRRVVIRNLQAELRPCILGT